MICKSYRNQVSPENLSELTTRFKELRLPLISKQQGFKDTYCMTKRNGEFMWVTFWETEADIHAWTKEPVHEQILGEQLYALLHGRGEHDIYEVQDIDEKAGRP